jgi:hypothetical protein
MFSASSSLLSSLPASSVTSDDDLRSQAVLGRTLLGNLKGHCLRGEGAPPAEIDLREKLVNLLVDLLVEDNDEFPVDGDMTGPAKFTAEQLEAAHMVLYKRAECASHDILDSVGIPGVNLTAGRDALRVTDYRWVLIHYQYAETGDVQHPFIGQCVGFVKVTINQERFGAVEKRFLLCNTWQATKAQSPFCDP